MNYVLLSTEKLDSNNPLRRVMQDQLYSRMVMRSIRNYLRREKIASSVRFLLTGPDFEKIASRHNQKLTGKTKMNGRDKWIRIFNGRYILSGMDQTALNTFLKNQNQDILLVNIKPTQRLKDEIVKVTSDSKIAGIKRKYNYNFSKTETPDDWPCAVFIRKSAFRYISDSLDQDFKDFIQLCRDHNLKIASFCSCWPVLDLTREKDIILFLDDQIDSISRKAGLLPSDSDQHRLAMAGIEIPESAALFGRIYLAPQVKVENDVTLVGPVVIGEKTTIRQSSMIGRSLLGSNQNISGYIDSRVIPAEQYPEPAKLETPPDQHEFKIWPRFSYNRFTKRILDIIFASGILIMFSPLFPILALGIKLSSPGPVFFGHKRQGLHGKEFKCLKFRTMITGADDIQDTLRSQNQVDGPQFKIEEDPRITKTGEFLRSTFLDEIPQFINILRGDMSVIGPRPSPVKENSFCPYWRDARLSVRPGITGLWQINRTRQPGQDFQEWIHYDTQYVKNISFRTDLLICIRTAKKLISNFFEKF